MARLTDFLRSAPVIMLLALLSGAAFAIGHHFFYHSLEGESVSQKKYSVRGVRFTATGQQINVAAGTAFAFLARALLAVAVSTAYDQEAWRAIKSSTSKIGAIDDLFSTLSSWFMLLKPTLWRRYPTLMVLALLFWLLPIAALFTPATLTVQLAGVVQSSLRRVPRVDFLSLNFAKLPEPVSTSAGWIYNGPQYAVQQTVIATLTQGQILSIPPPSVNSSWAFDFAGPELTCNPVNSSLHTEIAGNIVDSINNGVCDSSYGYISWTPDLGVNGSLPFVDNGNGTYSLRSGTIGPAEYGAPLSLYVAAIPDMLQGIFSLSNTTCDEASSSVHNATILKCDLFNTTYIANFTYVNGVQDVDFKTTGSHGDIEYLDFVGGAVPFASFVDGKVDSSSYNLSYIETFSYQAVVDAFGEVMVGSIANIRSSLDNTASIQTSNTTIMTTSLGYANELVFLKRYWQDYLYSTDLISIQSAWNGYSVVNSYNATLPLATAIEEAFHNITISLMSASSLQPNYSSPYAPPYTNVTMTTYQNVYSYSSEILWIAYGIAIAVTVLSVIIGLTARVRNGGGYTFKFSTILRVTRDVHLSTTIAPADVSGKDPLPSYIAKAKISWPDQEEEELRPFGQQTGWPKLVQGDAVAYQHVPS